jgi:predicted phage terminase large subunit-like protein
MTNPIQMMRERTRAKLVADFSAFARRAWKEIEPGKELQWSWHHELVCEYLTLAYHGETTRLIITQPPRSLKSKLVSVLFPAWVWAQRPEQSFILTSYSDSLSEELNMSRRTLLQSAWFQSTFPGKVFFSPDQNRREQFKNTAGGQAVATSVEGTLTGKGADYLLIDDILSPQQSYSDLERQNANRFFDSTLRSRLNEPTAGRIVVICQRLHEVDLPGHLMENEPGVWTLVNLPMEAEADEQIVFPISGRVIERKAGDLLHPARFPKSWCEKQKRTMGRMIWSSQFQQRPSPIEGNIVKAADIQYFGGRDWTTGVKDPDVPETFERVVLSCDCSFKDKSTSDYVCILVVGVNGPRRYVRHIVNARMDLDGTENEIRAAHANYGPISAVLVEDKANGSAVIAHLKEEISGLVPIDPQGGKMSRMMAAAPEFQANNWFFDRTGAWTNKAVDQLCNFPNAKNDDIADAVTQCSIWLQSHTYELGLLDYFKQVASGAKKLVSTVEELFRHKRAGREAVVEEKKPVVVTRDQWLEYLVGHPGPPCPHPDCKSPCTFLQVDHRGVRHITCRQCGRTDGRDLPGTEKPGHVHRWHTIPGNQEQCWDCSEQRPIGNGPPPTTNGCTFKQLAALNSRSEFGNGRFGRFS